MICGSDSSQSSFLFLFDSYGINGSVDPCGVASSNVPCNVSETPFLAEYDLGANYAADFDVADWIYIGGLYDLVIQEDVTVRVRASNDSGFASYDEDSIVVTSADLIGTTGRDWAGQLSFSTARRYWRVSLETANPITGSIGCIVLGSAFSFNRNPSSNVVIELEDAPTEGRKNLLKVSINMKGVLGSKKSEYSNQFLRYVDVMPVILLDPNDQILFGYQAVRARCTDSKTTPSNTQLNYDLKLDFQELL